MLTPQVLVDDINLTATAEGAIPAKFTEANGTLFFVASTALSGSELWKTDGTESGTVLVKDIRTGTDSSNLNSLTNVGGTLYFVADDGINGAELWKTDGTTDGTVLVKDIFPGISGANLNSLTSVGSVLYFNATDGTNGPELWKSDGTAGGTVLVKDIRAGASGSNPNTMVAVGSQLFFTASDGSNGRELWVSDGSEAGTILVKDIRTGTNGSNPSALTNVGGTLFFAAGDDSNGRELWKSDGTAGGTVLIKDVRSGFDGSNPSSLTTVGGMLFFTAGETTNGRELWVSDGTEGGTVLVKDIRSGTGSSNPNSLVAVGSTLFFTAVDGVNGRELWKSDGSEGGTTLVTDLRSGTDGSNPTSLVNVGGTLYFAAVESTNGRELWKTDGSEAGTVLVKDIRIGVDGSNPVSLTTVGSSLFFTAGDGINGREIWKSNGTEVGTQRVKDIRTGTFGADPSSLTNVNGTVYFVANNDTNGYELWKSDGSDTGTVLVQDIASGLQSSFPGSLTNVNGTLFFTADDGMTGRELWTSDGTAVGTTLLKDIYVGTLADSSNPGSMISVNGALFFAADDGVSGRELWTSDGTTAGTVLFKDIEVSGGSSPDSLTKVSESLFFFTAYDSVYGTELWKSDGTPAGTMLVKDIFEGTDEFSNPNGSAPRYLTNVGGVLYFIANDGIHGDELWTSDGTTEGTVLVKDIRSGSDGSFPYSLTSVGNTLYFTADDGTNGQELWKSNGTGIGTVMVKDILEGGAGSNPQWLTSFGNVLLFVARDGSTGTELWKSDGTAEGTELVKDVRSGFFTSNPRDLVAVRNLVYFVANDGIHGDEIWKSDGTQSGTMLIEEVTIGSVGFSPSQLSSIGNTLFFTADDGQHGTELWSSPNSAPVISAPDISVEENSTTVAIISDDDNDTLALSITGGADMGLFEFDGNTIRFINAPDFEVPGSAATSNMYFVTVRADDSFGGVTIQDITITVTDVNEAPTVDLTNTTTSLAENSNTSSDVKVADISITDDALGSATLTLSGSDADVFVISGNELFLKSGTELNFEAKSSYSVTVEVDDATLGGTPDATVDFTLTITDVNEAPSDVSLVNTTTTFVENTNTSSNVKVADISVTDDALGSETLSLSGADASAFVISGTELFVKAGTTLDFESKSSYSVTVEVDDSTVGDNPDVSVNFTLTITDVNEAPTAVSLLNTTTTLVENTNTSSNVKVADISVTDDALGTETLSLSGTDATTFVISGTELFVKAGTTLNFEAQSSYSVTVNVNDSTVGGNPDDTTSFTLTITDVNEAPTLELTNTTTSLAENSDTSSNVKVADISVTDDALGSESLTLSGADAAAFVISAGELFLKSGTTLNFESKSSYSVTVNVDDSTVGGTPDATASFTLTITDVNEAPSNVSLINTTTTLVENTSTSSNVKVADISVTDDALGSETLSLSGADASAFVISGTELFVKSGTTLNFEAQSSYSVTVNVNDSTVGSTPDATASFTLTITDVNEAPTAVSFINSTTDLDENTDTSSDIKVADISVTDDALGSETFSLSGADGAAFVLNGTELFLKSGTTLNFESKSSYSVTVNVNDSTVGGNPDVSANFTLALNDLNEAPTVAHPIADQSTNAGTPLSFVFAENTFNDVDASDQLTYVAQRSSGSALPSWLSFNGASRTFSGTPEISDLENISIEVTATDLAGLSVSDTFELVVTSLTVTEEGGIVTLTDSSGTSGNQVGATISGDNLVLDIDGILMEIPLAGLTNLVINLGAGNDTLNLDLRNGPLPFDITFNGGAGGVDSLNITNFDESGDFTSYTANYTNSHDGSIQLRNGDATTFTLRYTGLEPIVIDGTPTEIVINLPNSNDTDVVLSDIDDTTDGLGNPVYLMRLSGSTFEDTDFAIGAATERVLINMNSGNDRLTIDSVDATFVGELIVNGGAGNDRLDATTSPVAVTLRGGDGNDTIIGSPNDDLLDGGAGIDALNGQGGTDTASIFVASKLTVTNRAANANGNDSLTSIEQLTIFGNSSNNLIDAAGWTLGKVSISGGAGNDTLIGSTFDDDTLDGGEGIDVVQQRSSIDQLATTVMDGEATLTGSIVVSGSGADVLRSSEALHLIVKGSQGRTLDARAFQGRVTLDGGSGHDVLFGGDSASVLNGNTGNDSVVGGRGDDTLLGGSGNDTLDGAAGNDVLRGQAGNDQLNGNSGEDKLFGEDGRDLLLGGNGQDVLDGGAHNDTLAGENGNDTIHGGAGDDALGGSSGDDVLNGNSGNDTLVGDVGNDVLNGGVGFDKIDAGAGDDQITASNDTISTGDGTDRIVGSSNRIDELFLFDFASLLP